MRAPKPRGRVSSDPHALAALLPDELRSLGGRPTSEYRRALVAWIGGIAPRQALTDDGWTFGHSVANDVARLAGVDLIAEAFRERLTRAK